MMEKQSILGLLTQTQNLSFQRKAHFECRIHFFHRSRPEGAKCFDDARISGNRP